MGITNRGGRYRAQGVGLDGKRVSGTFNTEAEAHDFLLKVRQARSEHKISRRNNSGNIDLDFEVAAVRTGTVASILEVALKVDWSDSESMRGRGVRACRMLGFNTPITDVTTETLDDLVAALKQDGIANGTIRTYLAALSVLLKRARRMKAIYELPLMPEGRTVRKAEPRDLVVQAAWFEDLLSRIEVDDWRLLTEFIWHMGCRVSEAQNLTWERVNFTSRRVQFVKTKSLNSRQLPMSQEVERILLQSRKAGNRQPFPSKYRAFRDHYRQKVYETCDYFGLGPDVQKEWNIHALRHTKLTRLANAGANAIQIKEWAGHHSLATSQGYIHSSGIDLESLVSVERRQAPDSWCIEGQNIY